MLKIDGKFIALKSNITDELQNIDNYYKKLFLKNEKIIEFKLPNELSNRTIYEVSKTKSTSLIYPRPYSQIKKKDI
jgi:16S rRNA G527 N7-methylase RsmG